MEIQTCPEWRDGFLLGDGTKVPIFQRPGLHGDAWFDKNKDYSLNVQVCSIVELSVLNDSRPLAS